MKTSRNFRRVALFLALALLAFLSTAVPVRTRRVYVCEMTGSVLRRTTWVHLINTDSCTTSPLERYIESKHPAVLQHRWVWVSGCADNWLGRSLLVEDSPHTATCLLAEYIQSGVFDRLSGEEKKQLYDILVNASHRLSDVQKRKMYVQLFQALNGKEVSIRKLGEESKTREKDG